MNEVTKLNGIIGCEESQEVTKAFSERGHLFHSCDLLPCSGGRPDLHIQDNIFHVLHVGLNFLGSHPPCTYLANSGVRWLASKRPRIGFEWSEKHQIYINNERFEKMRLAAIFFRSLYSWTQTIGMGYLENPIMHKYALEIIGVKPDQIIQPWQFGHGETKATCLWLVNLPKLKPSNIVEGREQRIWKLPPSEDRARQRSKTFPGIAAAMACQWSDIKPSKHYRAPDLFDNVPA